MDQNLAVKYFFTTFQHYIPHVFYINWVNMLFFLSRARSKVLMVTLCQEFYLKTQKFKKLVTRTPVSPVRTLMSMLKKHTSHT